MNILQKHIYDSDILSLLEGIISSFHSEGKMGVGLPLGNLTSQLLVNVYMNEFDQFVKRNFGAKHYIRYADDFVFLHEDKGYLEKLLQKISAFLSAELKLALHPDKVFITTFASGVDFLGWVNFSYHRVLRTKTKQRMLKRLSESGGEETLPSYLGLLGHGNTYGLVKNIRQKYALNAALFWRG